MLPIHALIPSPGSRTALILATAALALPGILRADGESTAARTLYLTGRYADAREAYDGLRETEPIASAIGVARCQCAVGELDGAARTLLATLRSTPKATDVRAELAGLEFQRGDYRAAQAQVDTALALDANQPAARFTAAELDRVAGRLERADEGYLWFVRLYNREQDRIRDPETLRWIGLAGAQYARWNRSSGQFGFLVNTLYPEVLKLDRVYWPAHLDAALLFIEKYNLPDALGEIEAGLKINPRAAELHAAQALIALQRFALDSARAAADRALAINPRLLGARRLRADAQMLASGPRAALPLLEAARALNPVDEETLGRIGAALGAMDGFRNGKGSARMESVIDAAVRQNEHCGVFYAALARSLDLLSRFPESARYYEEARRRMPQLVSVPGELGLAYMKLGEEDRARAMLKVGFDIDPFNIRVKNSLEVLDLLKGYRTVETAHFVIRFDPARDSLLARTAARYLEEDVYPEIVKAFGYQPEGKSLFEIFGSARGTDGHAWFSVRMAGLPFIGTVGASTGRMVGITSPNERGRRFNWARVLKHEFVHVMNLQQTNFAIPRWFTEGLAVRHEGPGHPQVWDGVLARRAAADKLFSLETIHLGFLRPSNGEDWALAYDQAALYVDYMVSAYGGKAPGKMIAAYRDHLDTPAALKRCFGVDQTAFEKGYRGYIDRIAPRGKGSGASSSPDSADVTTLERAAEKHPRDADLLARLGYATLLSGRPFAGRDWAVRALEIDPKQQLAALVVARVSLFTGMKTQALEALRASFDPVAPQPEALALLAQLTLDAGSYPEAERLYHLGLERFPLAADWQRGLAVVYRKTGQRERLAATLEQLVEGAADDLASRVELEQLALERQDLDSAARWARETLDIDVMDPGAHATLARALAEHGHRDRSIEEFETAISLKPEALEWRLALAKVYAASGKKDVTRKVLGELLERDPHYPGARELLETLGRR